MSELTGVLESKCVAVAAGVGGYGRSAPFSPDMAWREYPFANADSGVTRRLEAGGTAARDGGGTCGGGTNGDTAHAGVREALKLLGLDAARFDTAEWNPLGGIVRPGDTVVLKPNCVREFRESSPDHADCVITHGAVIRAVLDYVYIALQGRGRMVIADAPHNDADFAAIRRIAGLDEIQEFYRRHARLPVEVYDLRPEQVRKVDGVIVGHEPLPGDPAGYVRVNLGRQSAFTEVNHLCHLLYGSEYDMSELASHHHDDVHEYLISRTVLDADVVISLPKLKTHKKVGLTVNLKNLVGINGNKNWLPHHREGTPSQGGDQFRDDGLSRRIERSVVARFKNVFPRLGPLRSVVAGPFKALGKRVFGDTNTDTVRSGNWYGNDTTWRMVHDLNRILLYARPDGCLSEAPVRRFFSVVDGVVAGEGNGPLDPRPKAAGLVLAGGNPVAVDLVCSQLMGFELDRLPVLKRATGGAELPLTSFRADEVVVQSNDSRLVGPALRIDAPDLAFVPHFGWCGHLERRITGAPTARRAHGRCQGLQALDSAP